MCSLWLLNGKLAGEAPISVGEQRDTPDQHEKDAEQRRQKLASIKKSLEDGTYRVDPDKVAEALLRPRRRKKKDDGSV